MERVLTENERIRRAEEIAYRRKYPNEKIDSAPKVSKTYFGSKIMLEILILINITIIIFCVQNKNEIFSEQFLTQIASYQTNLQEKGKNFWNSMISIPEDATIFQNEVNESQNQNTENPAENVTQTEGVGGGIEEASEESNVETQEAIVESNESDSTKIKNSYDLIQPITGKVTSPFGNRNSENKKIDGYHTGTDIASSMGTDIVSAMSGKVILVSGSGDYGKHLKIQNGDVITLYAHCSEILVKEGDEVEKGTKIAKVGSTGNSTGPHLHFEIRYQDRYVNPQEIFQFE